MHRPAYSAPPIVLGRPLSPTKDAWAARRLASEVSFLVAMANAEQQRAPVRPKKQLHREEKTASSAATIPQTPKKTLRKPRSHIPGTRPNQQKPASSTPGAPTTTPIRKRRYGRYHVFELFVDGIVVMRRVRDDWINSTQLMAAYDNPSKTTVQMYNNFLRSVASEDVAFNNFKPAGIWISLDSAIALAQKLGTYTRLRPILQRHITEYTVDDSTNAQVEQTSFHVARRRMSIIAAPFPPPLGGAATTGTLNSTESLRQPLLRPSVAPPKLLYRVMEHEMHPSYKQPLKYFALAKMESKGTLLADCTMLPVARNPLAGRVYYRKCRPLGFRRNGNGDGDYLMMGYDESAAANAGQPARTSDQEKQQPPARENSVISSIECAGVPYLTDKLYVALPQIPKHKVPVKPPAPAAAQSVRSIAAAR